LEKYLGIPTVFVRLHGDAAFGFTFALDRTIKHNLLDRCFFEEWINFAPIPAIENSECILERYPVFPPTYEQLGTKRIMCKDGVRKVCDTIKLDFTIKGRDGLENYSEPFSITPDMCNNYYIFRNEGIVGVLGNDFLKRHKWILDYATITK